MNKNPQEVKIPPPELRPSEPPGDVPDFAEEFTTSGVDKEDWLKKKNSFMKNDQSRKR